MGPREVDHLVERGREQGRTLREEWDCRRGRLEYSVSRKLMLLELANRRVAGQVALVERW